MENIPVFGSYITTSSISRGWSYMVFGEGEREERFFGSVDYEQES